MKQKILSVLLATTLIVSPIYYKLGWAEEIKPEQKAGGVQEETNRIYCSKCGTKNLLTDKYCSKCGAELRKEFKPLPVKEPAKTPPTEQFSTGYLKGQRDATYYHSAGGYFWGGLVCGFLLGLIGTGITVVVAHGSSPEPGIRHTYDLVEKNVNYVMGYKEGYRKNARDKNIRGAWRGGLLGTLLIVALLVGGGDGGD